MKQHTVTIRLKVESDDTTERLAEFYREIVTDYEGTGHKTSAVRVFVDDLLLE